jgi:hypothetical protein
MKLKCLAAALATALVLGTAAAPAGAEDAFYFQNETGIGFTGSMAPPEGECWFGITGIFIPSSSPSSGDGSVRSDNDPFDNCAEIWDPYLGYHQHFDGSYVQEGFPVYLFSGGVGAVGFMASDPDLTSASTTCNTPGAEWEEANGYTPIEPYMTTEVDGTTCTVDWVPGMSAAGAKASAAALSAAKKPATTHLRFVSSLARVVGGEAQVEIQAFGRPRAEVRVAVRLTTKAGKPLGQGKAWTWVGAKPRIVAVPLRLPTYTTFMPKPLELKVRAVLTHVDGSAGSGDSTKQLLLR